MTEVDLHYYEQWFQEMGLNVVDSSLHNRVGVDEIWITIPLVDDFWLRFEFDGKFWSLSCRCADDGSYVGRVNWPNLECGDVGLCSQVYSVTYDISASKDEFEKYLKMYVIDQLASV